MGKWNLENFSDPRFTGEAWDWWLADLEGMKPKTAQNYTYMVKGYLEHEDWTTEDLFTFHRENCQKEDTRARKKLALKVVTYQKTLLAKGKSTGTAELVEKALRSFFKSNEIEFKINGAKRIKRESKEIANIPKDDLIQLLEGCGSIRLTAATYFLKDSGMRISDAVEVKVADIQQVLTEEINFFTWTITQKKTKRKADPVIGPEAIAWLKKWMKDRENRGITSEWLFCLVEQYGENRKAGDKMEAGTLGQLFRSYRDKAGLEGVSIHSLRKFHKTGLEYAGVPSSWVNKMQGRKGVGTGGIYTKPNSDQLIGMFKRGYNELSLNPESISKYAKQELQGLQGEMQEMKKKMNSMMEFISAFSSQENGVESYKQFTKIEKDLEAAPGIEDKPTE